MKIENIKEEKYVSLFVKFMDFFQCQHYVSRFADRSQTCNANGV